ncbi:probable tRNA N6-adenosine threonylcarbamoyltransferase, mitochondrial [Culex pipiens pallens]|uniref:probable tRNA N6-adenosine threonylcarbamoyltransferase, mitochondrial n=1 Tax=Culex pipiens pallens TaxID=42434 RepID=UPI001952C0CD|nr:probable tRNA N6-adenosine threonylcarbamoyltransferase, mitochondrial [Culex pipiens pallens]
MLLKVPVSVLFCNRFVWRRHSSQLARPFVLGIESSCDDSGAAIVSRDGTVLGEDVHSQQNNHLKFGGIIPPVAQEFHRDHIANVVQRTLEQANMSCGDLDAIAVTNRPGLPLSLLVGVRYAKHLGRKFNKPIIPIHHMEAHALMARMTNKVPFPFVCILISGGHSLLTLVKNTKQFYLLGKTLDDAPGEAFDKIARRLKLRNLPEYAWISGGRAIELAAASSTNMAKYDFPLPLSHYRDCQFSFAGLKNTATRHILQQENQLVLAPDAVLPDYNDLCAAFLNASARHIAQRTLRAIRFCEKQSLIQPGDPKTLVISGGVACNDFIYQTVSKMAESVGYVTVRPLKKHCTDNGVMIAWNGVEKFAVGQDIVLDYDSVDIVGKTPLGVSLIEMVKDANIPSKM